MTSVTAMVQTLEGNLEEVRGRIQAAVERAGRDSGEVEILPITKGHPEEVVRAAYEIGFRAVGENRVGEGLTKRETLAELEGLRWEMVGHVQSRKASDVAPAFSRVHSVDRMKIARHLNKHAGNASRVLPVFLECNVSGEESKYGWELDDPDRWTSCVEPFAKILEMENLRVEGLMTMAPWVDDDSVVRGTFRRLRELRDFLQEELPRGDWEHLSMGMTDDYELAVEEGATILRLGRALFGERRW